MGNPRSLNVGVPRHMESVVVSHGDMSGVWCVSRASLELREVFSLFFWTLVFPRTISQRYYAGLPVAFAGGVSLIYRVPHPVCQHAIMSHPEGLE